MNAPQPRRGQPVDAEAAQLRVPPHSAEAEQSLLGGLLWSAGAFDKVADLVQPGDFYAHEHRLIFEAIRGLVLASKPVDVVTVFEELQRRGQAADCGGLAYLNAIAQSVPSAANARRYAEIVQERAVLRHLIAAADEIATAAFNPQGRTAADVLELAGAAIGALERAGQREQPQPLEGLLLRALDRYSALADGTAPPAMRTGIAPLDRILAGGLRPGKVYGLAARPSIGKSAAGRAIGLCTAADGHATLLLSQEMPSDEVVDCVVGQLGGINGERLQTGRLTDGDWARLTDAAEIARALPFYVDDQGGLRLADIRSKARAIKGLRVLVLDYMQLSRSTLKNATTNDQIAEISKGLKALAMELKIAVVVLSQLNRQVESRMDREPQLSDLRDSGAIEQDLDVAVLLWTVRERADGAERLVGWKVAKHRGGRKGRFGMLFVPPTYAWTETDESIEAPARPTSGRGFTE